MMQSKRSDYILSKIACLIIIIALIVGVKSAYIQQAEQDVEEEILTSTLVDDEEVSENVSTNSLQSHLDYSMNVQDVSRGDVKRVPMDLPSQTSGEFKTYMSYKMISDTSSKQYKLQQQAYTDEDGFRKVGDYYCIALGSAYGTEIGTKYRIVLDTGIEFMGILSDCKDNTDTDSSNKYIEKNGNICEFIVSVSKINEMSKVMGDMSYSNLEGGILSIEKVVE